MTIPDTWRDVTDDVCPRPQHGLRMPTQEEMREAEDSHYTPRRMTRPSTASRKERDFSNAWKDEFQSEGEWLRVLLSKHRTCSRVGRVIGASQTWVVSHARRAGIPMEPGRGYVGDRVAPAPDPEAEGRSRKFGSGFKLDLTAHWKGRYETERDWLVAMLQEHGTCKAIGRSIGVSRSAVVRLVRAWGIPIVRGKGYVGETKSPSSGEEV